MRDGQVVHLDHGESYHIIDSLFVHVADCRIGGALRFQEDLQGKVMSEQTVKLSYCGGPSRLECTSCTTLVHGRPQEVDKCMDEETGSLRQ